MIAVKEYSEDTTEFLSRVRETELEAVEEGVERDLSEENIQDNLNDIN